MNVLRLYGPGDLRLASEPDPLPGPGEVLLRVTAVGLCGSDLHWFSQGRIGDSQLERPLVPGHEFAGMVEWGELAGQRVAVDPAISCGGCEFCRTGNPNLCLALRFAGHGAEDGSLREYMAWPARCLHPLPDSLTDVDGALLEPLGVAIHAVDLGHLRPGATVGVFGCGPVGLLVLQVARVAGASNVLVTDKLPHRLEAAESLAATAVFQTAGGVEVLEATGGRGVDVAFEAAGENEAVEGAINAVRPGGRVILIGIPPDERTAFSASAARRKGLTIKLVRRAKHAYTRAIRLAESGVVDLTSLVTHRFPLTEFSAAFAAAERREGLKVVIEP